MKSNFKIKDKDMDKKENYTVKEKTPYENYLDSLPKGWNLWSIRSSNKK